MKISTQSAVLRLVWVTTIALCLTGSTFFTQGALADGGGTLPPPNKNDTLFCPMDPLDTAAACSEESVEGSSVYENIIYWSLSLIL